MPTNASEAAEQPTDPQQQLPCLEDFTSPYLPQARSLIAPTPNKPEPYVIDDDELPNFRCISSEHPAHKQVDLDLIQLKHRLNYVAWMPDAFPWGDLPHGATVVDVGGNDGVACIALARAFPHLKFIVQALPGGSDTSLVDVSGEDIKNCIQFQAYDYNTTQTVKGAEVYFFKNALAAKVLSSKNDAMDDACFNPLFCNAETLRNQIPAFKDGSHLLIIHPLDYRDVGVPETEVYRNADLVTVKLCRAIESEVENAKALFEASIDTKMKLPWVLNFPKSAIAEPVPDGTDGDSQGSIPLGWGLWLEG